MEREAWRNDLKQTLQQLEYAGMFNIVENVS